MGRSVVSNYDIHTRRGHCMVSLPATESATDAAMIAATKAENEARQLRREVARLRHELAATRHAARTAARVLLPYVVDP